MDYESTAGVKYYFEIIRRAGRIYLDRFSFGDGFELQIEGSLRAMPQSPVKLYPGARSDFNQLHEMLGEYYNHKDTPPRYDPVKRYYHNLSQLPECLIGAEVNENQKIQIRTMYRLFKCRVIGMYQPKVQSRRKYVIEFKIASRS